MNITEKGMIMSTPGPADNPESTIKAGYRSSSPDIDYEIMRKKYRSGIEHVRKVLDTVKGTLEEIRNLESMNRQSVKHQL